MKLIFIFLVTSDKPDYSEHDRRDNAEEQKHGECGNEEYRKMLKERAHTRPARRKGIRKSVAEGFVRGVGFGVFNDLDDGQLDSREVDLVVIDVELGFKRFDLGDDLEKLILISDYFVNVFRA